MNIYRVFSLIKVFLYFLIILICPNLLFADDEVFDDNITDYEIEDTFIMEDMNVIESIGIGADSGITEIPREMLEYIPSSNQGITDMLRITSGVQFSESYRSSTAAGEIKPAEVSISGANPYENLFLLDGMSNSSLLDPASNNPNLANDVAGDPQKFFISSWLVEDVTLMDSDVSASYDGFLGGVVDVKTRQPGTKFGGSFSYRGTNNYLTNFFITDENQQDFDNGQQSKQLKFEKHFLSGALDIPIKDRGGILLSYNRNWSKIPFKHFKDWKDQSRLSESIYTKGIYNIDSASHIEASLSYSPNSGHYFLKNTKDSDFKIYGGGVFSAINYINEKNGNKMKFHADYSFAENNRSSPKDFKAWATTPYKPWGEDSNTSNTDISLEGGFGDIKKEEQGAKISFDHKIKPLEFYGEHNISYGLVYSYNDGRYNRTETSYNYKEAVLSSGVICNGDTGTCVDGDQYLSTRYVTPKSNVMAAINAVGVYIEEDYQIERVNIRAGLRFGYDDYMNNFNVSPRIRLTIDILNNGNTTLTGGYNRYYAASMLTYKLREGRAASYVEKRWTERNELSDWHISSDNILSTYKFSGLKTPYNDEYTASINQKVLGSYINLKYVERHGKDGIALSRGKTEKGIVYYTFNNNGQSLYRGVQLKWSKSWKNHSLMANLTWSMSETSNNSYDDTYDIEELDTKVFYNGKKISLHELPKSNFARPVILNISYVGKFLEFLRFSTSLNYRSPYKALEKVGDQDTGYTEKDPVTGETIVVTTSSYEDVYYGNNVTVDIGLYWEQPVWAGTKLTIFTEVYNLFNTKNVVGKKLYSKGSTNDYELGTQIWFGVNYEF